MEPGETRVAKAVEEREQPEHQQKQKKEHSPFAHEFCLASVSSAKAYHPDKARFKLKPTGSSPQP
jgi:hypothetical protein